METPLSNEIDDLKIIYKEIIDGYSFIDEKNIYLKHLNDIENGELAKSRNSLFFKFKQEGLLTEEEKLKQLIASEEWSLEKEDEILSYKYNITDNEKNLNKIIIQQRPPIQKMIDDMKNKLSLLLLERRNLISTTVEEFAEKYSLFSFICMSFFEDKSLKQKKFPKNLDDLENTEIEEYIKIIEIVFKKFSDANIRKIAVLPFFLNPLSFCKENIQSFIGIPLSQLTNQQLTLLSLGTRNLRILNNIDKEAPQLMGDTKIDTIVNFFDMEYSILISKKSSRS